LRKILSFVLLFLLSVSLSACGNVEQQAENTSPLQTDAPVSAQADEKDTGTNETGLASEENMPENEEEKEAGETDILIAYFSRADENYGVGMIEKGNTEIIAEMIADETGGELFHIERSTPYPADYDECTDEAKIEQEENARPELALDLENIESYDTIFLGYPIWWSDMPMAVYTFLESHDFAGKTIIPFCTHAGSGLSSTVSSIQAVCPDATVLDGFSIQGSTAQNERSNANEAVMEWLRKNSFIE